MFNHYKRKFDFVRFSFRGEIMKEFILKCIFYYCFLKIELDKIDKRCAEADATHSVMSQIFTINASCCKG